VNEDQGSEVADAKAVVTLIISKGITVTENKQVYDI
jgi:hypothetical protein